MALGKIRRAANVKTLVGDNKSGDNTTMRERQETTSKSREVNKTKCFCFHFIKRSEGVV